ncbi:hypothetical protein MD588_23335 [Photobacterium sp. SDRW27]|uniref:DUF6162 family protein n=1 Tax=Photobacterium obscurum TaxID=2829490 RepID=UPI002244CB70|nr:hypothetical protein [Photobacterium obscurum]MCW8331738.1 hypothetical protein [Photobacterium obscurum]
MNSQTVLPDDGGREGKWVALSIAVILLVATALIPYHQTASQQDELALHQISIQDLPSLELAMIADLRLAHEEIRNLRQDNLEFKGTDYWPQVNELEELWLAPFVQDKSWEHKGKHQWKKIADGFYLGKRQLEEGSASVILHSQYQQPDIWLDLNGKAGTWVASTPLSVSALIDAGWIQVVFSAQEDVHLH